MKKPLIALIPQVDEEGRWWMNPDYLNSVSRAGGIGVVLPLTADDQELEEIYRRSRCGPGPLWSGKGKLLR